MIISHNNNNKIVFAWFVETQVHAIRVGLAYIVMLGVVSYDVGVHLVALAGRGLGFLIFGTKAFGTKLELMMPPNFERANCNIIPPMNYY